MLVQFIIRMKIIDCHNFATMHSCAPSKNCMAISQFYILFMDYGRQVYY